MNEWELVLDALVEANGLLVIPEDVLPCFQKASSAHKEGVWTQKQAQKQEISKTNFNQFSREQKKLRTQELAEALFWKVGRAPSQEPRLTKQEGLQKLSQRVDWTLVSAWEDSKAF